MVGQSPCMHAVYRMARLVAPRTHAGAHHRSERHRQGSGGRGDSSLEPARQQGVRGHQLRRHSGGAAGVGAVRLCARRLHRCSAVAHRTDSQRARRHPVSRRDRRAAAGHAGQAAALPRSGRSAAAGQLGRVSGRRAGAGGKQRQSRRAGASASSSARTCSIACRCFPSSCLRWPQRRADVEAAGAPLPAQVRAGERPASRSRRKPCGCWRSTPGRAMCASCSM